jgi:hypothetical protein
MRTEAERAYLAGIIDGEGSIMANIRQRGGCVWFELRLNIANADRALIEWVAERWPGRVSVIDRSRYGQRDQHRWDANNRKVIAPLLDAFPYLVVKREQAELALELAHGQRNHGRRGYPPEIKARRIEICERMRALNKKAPGCPT